MDFQTGLANWDFVRVANSRSRDGFNSRLTDIPLSKVVIAERYSTSYVSLKHLFHTTNAS